MKVRDCNENWATCPIEKRVWLQNNPKIIKFLKKEALKERGFFENSRMKVHPKTHLAFRNKALKPVAKLAIEAGLYKTKSLQAVGESLQNYVERAFGIKRFWLPDGWKAVMTKKRMDTKAMQSIYKPIGTANSFPFNHK